MEHAEGQLKGLGDALGTDCLIVPLVDGRPTLHRGMGRENADYLGWNAAVLAPFDGVVERVRWNYEVNTPGTLGSGIAGHIVVSRADGVRVMLAHVQGIRVREGASVRAGQVVGQVGNNGQSRMPHTHLGAWQGTEPLQIRFDLRAQGRLLGAPTW
jgi:murein DD-endopeptidase MepM/ murein hydrolase activator NlpD